MNEIEILRLALFFALGWGAHNLALRIQGWAILRLQHKANCAQLAQMRFAFQHRRRGRIVKVGSLEIGPDGKQHPVGFEIEAAGAPVWSHGPDGEVCRAGYTEEELLEIAKRAAEFRP